MFTVRRLVRVERKTDILWCDSPRRMTQSPSDRVMICGSNIQPVSSVRDLRVWIDSGVTMSTHSSKAVAGCFASLRQLRSIRWSLTQATLTGLVVSLVLTCIDYCNSVLSGLPSSWLNGFEAVINTAARLILSRRQFIPWLIISSSYFIAVAR